MTHGSSVYKTLFGTGTRVFLTIFVYDFIIFGSFYSFYICSLLGNNGVLTFSPTIYYSATISTIVTTNLVGFILMIFVLYHIYSSMRLVERLDQKQMLYERKRIAWVIIFQAIINFFLCTLRISAFYNVSISWKNLPPLDCRGAVWNFIDKFMYFIQEFFVCLDGIMYIFFLTPYREQLFKFVKKILRWDKVHITVNSVFDVRNSNVTNRR